MKQTTRNHSIATVTAAMLLVAAWCGSARAAAPILDPIANMSLTIGGCAPPSSDQAIRATDADGDAITFTWSGPSWMTVTGDTQVGTVRTGNIHLSAPPPSTFGSFPATVTANAGGQSDSKSFQINVVQVNQVPVLAQPFNMTVAEGATADQTITASDPCSMPLSFALVSGPTFLTVTTTNATTGNIHAAPGFSDASVSFATIRATNGSLSDNKSLTITVSNVNRAPVLTQPANMTVEPAGTRDQVIHASDPDGDALTFSKVSGPTFMTVTTTNATTGNINLATGFSDPFGTSSATVSASDGTLTDSKSFIITVQQCNLPPTLAQPANMTVTEGRTADQVINGTSPCGHPLVFTAEVGPNFITVTTVNVGTGTATGNVHVAPGFSDSGTYTATIRVSDFNLTSAKSFTITVNNDPSPSLSPIANMFVPTCAAVADQPFTAMDGDGDAITITSSGPPFMTVSSSPQVGTTLNGNIHVAPSPATPVGTYGASVTATAVDGSATRNFVIALVSTNVAPVLSQPATMSLPEGGTADQTITASDPCDEPLVFSKVTGPLFMTVTTISSSGGSATGNIHLAPGFNDAGTYTATIRVSDGSLADEKNFFINVSPTNRCPVANPGGPYSGGVGVPLNFDGTGTADPDGETLLYAWDFGDGGGANGVNPVHAYSAAGTYTVTLNVSDPQVCTDTANTVAVIAPFCPATVFNGYDVIRLANGKPTWFALVQPDGDCYVNAEVVLSSFVLEYGGMRIPAERTKTTVNSDKSGDGIQEIRVSFLKEHLRTLFAGIPAGHVQVEVAVEANLTSGSILRGTTTVEVVSNGSASAVEVSPNPFNPEATLTFTTSRPGPVRVDLFDVGGRLVRRILDEPRLGAGTHEVRIGGTGKQGESLASGIYFIRGVSSDGEFKRTVVMLK